MSLDYTEWCHENGLDYHKVDHHEAWQRYVDEETHKPSPPISRHLSGRITMSWQQERTAELRRRSYQKHWQIILPRSPLRIVSPP